MPSCPFHLDFNTIFSGPCHQGAEERLEVLKIQKKMLKQGGTLGETVPKLIGHIEKLEPGDDKIEPENKGDVVDEEEDVGGRQTADKGAATGKEVGGRQTANSDAAARKEVGGGQTADKDIPNDETTGMPTGSKKADEKKKWSTPSVIRLREQR